MARLNVFNLRLSDQELDDLKSYAESKQISPAEVLRDYIKRLPKNRKKPLL
jgi:hypothetical protein